MPKRFWSDMPEVMEELESGFTQKLSLGTAEKIKRSLEEEKKARKAVAEEKKPSAAALFGKKP